jgi:hypothetical protein
MNASALDAARTTSKGKQIPISAFGMSPDVALALFKSKWQVHRAKQFSGANCKLAFNN